MLFHSYSYEKVVVFKWNKAILLYSIGIDSTLAHPPKPFQGQETFDIGLELGIPKY